MRPFSNQELAEKEFTHEGFTGLRNNTTTSRFGLTDLEVARNVDLDDTGRASRRDGRSKVVTGSCHSLGPSGFTRCFYVSGMTLYELLNNYSTVAMATVTPNLPITYFVSGTRYYWTNGIDKGCIEGSTNRSWGLIVPPMITGTVGAGTLMLGKEDKTTARYQFTMTYLRNDGQESGAGPANYLDVPNSGGIEFSNIPVSSDPTVTRKAIYISEANSEKLFLAIRLLNATTSVIYRDRGRMTLPLATQFLGPPPSGTVISQQGGSMLMAVDNRLHYSEPYAFELFDKRKYHVFPSKINIVCSFDEGTHIGTQTEHVWLHAGTPDQFNWDSRAPYGAIPGTLDFIDNSFITFENSKYGGADVTGPIGIWATTNGIVAGTPDGHLRNMTGNKFLYPEQPRGAGLVRFTKGIGQYLVTLQGTETPAPSAF